MANHSSAKKALRQTIRKTIINKSRMSRIKTYIKKVHQAISEGEQDKAKKAFIVAQSEVMVGVTKGVLKLNKASRVISRLAHKIKKIA